MKGTALRELAQKFLSDIRSFQTMWGDFDWSDRKKAATEKFAQDVSEKAQRMSEALRKNTDEKGIKTKKDLLGLLETTISHDFYSDAHLWPYEKEMVTLWSALYSHPGLAETNGCVNPRLRWHCVNQLLKNHRDIIDNDGPRVRLFREILMDPREDAQATHGWWMSERWAQIDGPLNDIMSLTYDLDSPKYDTKKPRLDVVCSVFELLWHVEESTSYEDVKRTCQEQRGRMAHELILLEAGHRYFDHLERMDGVKFLTDLVEDNQQKKLVLERDLPYMRDFFYGPVGHDLFRAWFGQNDFSSPEVAWLDISFAPLKAWRDRQELIGVVREQAENKSTAVPRKI